MSEFPTLHQLSIKMWGVFSFKVISYSSNTFVHIKIVIIQNIINTLNRIITSFNLSYHWLTL